VRSNASSLAAGDAVGRLEADGRAVSKVLCASCHTLDGYLAFRPLVAGRSVGALEQTIARLAVPLDAGGQPTTWDGQPASLRTWRGRYMPPFVGSAHERHALAVYLALLGGATPEQVRSEATAGDAGRAFFDGRCAMCHGEAGEWPMSARPSRSVAEYYEMLGTLPAINDVMPPFEGDEALRQAVAWHLSTLGRGAATKGER
jgi:mono/diheme cytochrome c family protein